MKTLNTQLDTAEINEDEAVYTVGDSILLQFYYGNFSDAVNEMRDNYISGSELIEYLEDKAGEYGYDNTSEMYNNHFSADFWLALGRERL